MRRSLARSRHRAIKRVYFMSFPMIFAEISSQCPKERPSPSKGGMPLCTSKCTEVFTPWPLIAQQFRWLSPLYFSVLSHRRFYYLKFVSTWKKRHRHCCRRHHWLTLVYALKNFRNTAKIEIQAIKPCMPAIHDNRKLQIVLRLLIIVIVDCVTSLRTKQ